MKRTTLIAMTVGSILGAALPGAYAQAQSSGVAGADNQPPQQVNPPVVGSAGPSTPQTTTPAVGQAGPGAQQTTAPAVGQAGPAPATDQGNDQHDRADKRAARGPVQGGVVSSVGRVADDLEIGSASAMARV